MCVWKSVVDEQLQQRQKNKGQRLAAIALIKFKENQVRSKNKCIAAQKTFQSGFSPFQGKEMSKYLKGELCTRKFTTKEFPITLLVSLKIYENV